MAFSLDDDIGWVALEPGVTLACAVLRQLPCATAIPIPMQECHEICFARAEGLEEKLCLWDDQEAAFDLALQDRRNGSGEVAQRNDLGDLLQMLWLQVGGETLPDGLAIGHGARGRVDAQEVHATQEKRDDGTSEVVSAYQPAEGNVATVVGRA